MLMTATLPRIYKEELEKMGISFQYQEFIKPVQRHRIKLEKKEIIEDISKIKEEAEDKKVLIIVNTVDKAIEIYQKLKEKKDKVNLLHSRFIMQDRNEKEREIKEFSKNKNERGIWITTQIVEASLDIDFDILYTEMSTLDSLFQRLGRCYRSREYKQEQPNVYIYTKNPSGIKYVYNEEISKNSIELLQKFDNQVLEESDKIKLVDKLYSREMLEGTEFLEKFEDGMKVLNNIIDYDNSKEQAQKLLRNIDNLNVIPKVVYEQNIELFQQYEIAEKNKNSEEKNKLRRKIQKLTTSISNPKYNKKIKECIIKNPYYAEIPIADFRYQKETGLSLKNDEIYEQETRIL